MKEGPWRRRAVPRDTAPLTRGADILTGSPLSSSHSHALFGHSADTKEDIIFDLKARLRVMEGRCETYAARWSEAQEQLAEVLAYVSDCDAERTQSHTLLVTLARENEALQAAMEEREKYFSLKEAEWRRRQDTQPSPPHERDTDGATAAALSELSEIRTFLQRAGAVTGVPANRSARLVDQVAELVALVVELQGEVSQASHVSLAGSRSPAQKSVKPWSEGTPDNTFTRTSTPTGRSSPSQRGLPTPPAAVLAHRSSPQERRPRRGTSVHRPRSRSRRPLHGACDPTMEELNEKIRSLESAIKTQSRFR